MRLWLLLLLIACADKPDIQPAGEIRILYVGNSLTYSNDLPALLKEIGALNDVDIVYKDISAPNFSLEDHWNKGQVQTEIQQGRYDFVIGQQGPSALPESQVLLLDFSTRISEQCTNHNSRFALYMVWPTVARSFDFDNVIFSYSQAAQKTNSVLCPAGLAWKKAWTHDPSMALYSADDFHPSIKGSVLAAITIYAALLQPSSLDFLSWDKMSWRNQVSKDELELMKQAALEALGK